MNANLPSVRWRRGLRLLREQVGGEEGLVNDRVLELLKAHLAPGALVVADNLFTFRRQLRGYVAYVRDTNNGFLSLSLFLKDGTEVSVRL